MKKILQIVKKIKKKEGKKKNNWFEKKKKKRVQNTLQSPFHRLSISKF